MNKLETNKLWIEVESFSLDSPEANYPFSSRLSFENSWTKHFTQQAILEYKKFMFLAAVTDKMISPSKIVDTVWHLHLIYTQSYSDFCLLLGKKINHIPGNQSKGEFQKFRDAQQFTQKQYENHFGEQPKEYWKNMSIASCLKLTPLNFNTSHVSYILIPLVLISSILFGVFIKPHYAKIDNDVFYPFITILAILIFLGLEKFNRSSLETFILERKGSILGHLSIQELIFYKTMNIKNVIHGFVNHLIESGIVEISPNYLLKKLHELPLGSSLEEKVILNELEKEETYYSRSIKTLVQEKTFIAISNSVRKIHFSILSSKEFLNIYIINSFIFFVLLTLSFSRVVTGFMRSKPIVFAIIFNIILVGLAIFYLFSLTRKIGSYTLPRLHKKKKIFPLRYNLKNWDEKYYLLGTAVFVTGFTTIYKYIRKNERTNHSDCGTNCSSDSSDCSSCSSCGGCGGDKKRIVEFGS